MFKMWSNNIWITLAVIVTISIDNTCQSKVEQESKIEIFTRGAQTVQQRPHNAQSLKHVTANDMNIGSRINTHVLFGDLFEDCMKEFVPFSYVDETCTQDGRHYVDGFNSQSLWAVQMYESSSKYPNKFFTGEVTEMGDFDLCMSVSSKKLGINGAYVLVSIQFYPINNITSEQTWKDKNHREKSTVSVKSDIWLANGPDSMLWSVCVPDSCSADDVRVSVERVLKPTFKTRNIAVNVVVPPPMYTSKSTTLQYSNGFFLTCVMAIGIVSLVVLGTLYGSLRGCSKPKHKTGFFENCLYSWSITDNLKSLGSSNNGDFGILNGIKVMGIIQMICFHRVVFNMAIPTSSTEFYNHIYNDFWLGFLKTQVPVESYFVLSGFLVYVKIENYLRNGHQFKFTKLFFYRVARIWPTYITTVLLFAFVLPYVSDGPMWKLVIYPNAESCQKNWWTNMLFINTYVDSYDMCMFHSWYLACDMHYYVIGIVLVYVVHRWKKVGLSVFGVLFGLSVFIPAKYIYDNKQWAFIPILLSNGKDVRKFEHFHNVYIKSEFRFTTYLIGIATAYVYFLVKNAKIKFSVTGRVAGCATCFFVMYLCMAVTGYFYLPNAEYNPWYHVLYFTFQRIAYSLCVSYLIVVGPLSNLGFVSGILESKVCSVVAKLSYAAYLIHPLVQMLSISQIRRPQYDNIWTLGAEVASDLATTLAYSMIINLIVETPSSKIVTHLMKKFSNEPSESIKNSDNKRNGQKQSGSVSSVPKRT